MFSWCLRPAWHFNCRDQKKRLPSKLTWFLVPVPSISGSDGASMAAGNEVTSELGESRRWGRGIGRYLSSTLSSPQPCSLLSTCCHLWFLVFRIGPSLHLWSWFHFWTLVSPLVFDKTFSPWTKLSFYGSDKSIFLKWLWCLIAVYWLTGFAL